jgi:hypothetical protein
MSTFGLSASHLASTTFCWLPPLRFPAATSTEGVLTFNFLQTSVAPARSRSRETSPAEA